MKIVKIALVVVMVIGIAGVGVPEYNFRNVMFVWEKGYFYDYDSQNYYQLYNNGNSPVVLSEIEISIYLVDPTNEKLLLDSSSVRDIIRIDSWDKLEGSVNIGAGWYAVWTHLDSIDMATNEYIKECEFILEFKATGNCGYWSRTIKYNDRIVYDQVN